MEKIKMTTPLVEMDGDEMTRILWKDIKEILLEPYIDLKTEYYDLGLPEREKTKDQVTVDSAEANQHGKVALQSPVAGTQVIEGTAVTLSVYRVASLVHTAQVDITLPESDASMDVRITLVDDEGIETEVYADTLAADSPRNTTVTIESTLTGSHVCRVYLDGSFAYQRTVTLE